jgi:hypothetical protein
MSEIGGGHIVSFDNTRCLLSMKNECCSKKNVRFYATPGEIISHFRFGLLGLYRLKVPANAPVTQFWSATIQSDGRGLRAKRSRLNVELKC